MIILWSWLLVISDRQIAFWICFYNFSLILSEPHATLRSKSFLPETDIFGEWHHFSGCILPPIFLEKKSLFIASKFLFHKSYYLIVISKYILNRWTHVFNLKRYGAGQKSFSKLCPKSDYAFKVLYQQSSLFLGSFPSVLSRSVIEILLRKSLWLMLLKRLNKCSCVQLSLRRYLRTFLRNLLSLPYGYFTYT